MGFDIECIVDIHTYPGEYFCPVCRTLVYPGEAVQSQCTHLYCKQCLLHVANGTKACPYDGYLVTEADSKPLVESDKALAENIGKVKVHCLFFRSGCTWEGALSECDAHCSVCSFGNSPVICNRCGVQIVHRQVHEHAQNCAGAYEAQQAVAAAAGSNTVATTTNVETNQPAAQASNGQVVAATQVSSSSQPVVVSSATSDQWNQQQYQQYYQQYSGYQPYPAQPYYQVQQQAYQQYPQQPALVQGQSQPAVNSHATATPQPQPQPQTQTHLISQIPQQPHLQPQTQGQGQPLPQQQMAPQAQVQNYPSIQPLPHPPVRPQTQNPSQSAPPSAPVQAASHPQGVATRPAGQIAQMPQYQQQAASQAHMQPQMHYPQPLSQPPPNSQTANQPYVQQMYHPQSQPFPRPPHLPIHANGLGMQPPVPQPPVHPAGAHHAFQQPMHAGLPQQHPGYPNPSSGLAQVHGQVPQQPVLMRPHVGSLPQSQSSALGPLQNQVSGVSPAQNQQFPSHAHQSLHLFQGRPAMQQIQQNVPQQYPQHQLQPVHASFQAQAQAHQQGPLALRPYGPPHSQQSQNYAGKPLMPSSGMHPSGDTGSVPDSGLVQPQSKQMSVNQVNAESSRLEQNSMSEAPKSSTDGPSDKALEVEKKEEGKTSGENLSEGGRRDEKMLKQEGSENLDMKSPKVAAGVPSTNPGKPGHIAESGSSAEGNKPAPKLHASLQQQHHGPGPRRPGYFGHPHNFESHSVNEPQMNATADRRGNVGRTSQQHPESHFGPHHLVRPSGGVMLRDQRSYDGGPLSQPYGNEPGFARMNGGPRPDSSMFDSRGEKRKTFAGESFDPFPLEQTRSLNPSLGYDAAPKPNAGGLGPHSRFLPPPVGPSRVGSFGPGPEFGQHNMKLLGPRSPDREYLGISPRGRGGSSVFPRANLFPDINGREGHRFGEGSRSFIPSSDLGNPFHDGRFPPLAGDQRRGNIDESVRFGDHMAPRLLHSHNRRPEFQDGPGHPGSGDVAGPGYFSGQFNNAETAGPGLRARIAEFGTESFRGMRNSFSAQGGPPNAAHFAGGMDSFDMSRKRRYISAGWCRICNIDCETVEGLDMHSQTREHQKMAMDMVKTIKQQNMKQHRLPGAHISHDGGRARKVGAAYHGNKP